MIAAAKGDEYKETMRAVVRACWNAGMQRKAMHKWFLESGESHRRSRLRGWRAWLAFCKGRSIDPGALKPSQNPEQLFASFLVWMDQPGHVKKHVKKDAPPAVQELFDMLRLGVKLNENAVIRTIRRNINSDVKAAPKDTVIWPLSIFFNYANTCPDPEKQPWLDLEGLAAAIFMVLLPCRPIALVRIDPSRARVRKSDNAVIAPAQEKTDSGKSRTELVFRNSPNPRTSTRFFYDILLRRALSLDVDDALFCSDKGQKYKRSDSILNALVRLLERMGVFGFTGYSFRHSLIQALFDAGLDEKQVNAYTGHSNNSHTALNYYFHLDKCWAGQKIQGTDRVPLSLQAQHAILAEGSEM
jgi:hypothetical protein